MCIKDSNCFLHTCTRVTAGPTTVPMLLLLAAGQSLNCERPIPPLPVRQPRFATEATCDQVPLHRREQFHQEQPE